MTAVSTQIEPFGLAPGHAQLQADARAVAAEFAPRAREVRQHLLDHSEMHPELWAAFCDRGWPGLILPAEYGGTEGGLLGMTVVLEAFAEQNMVLWMPVLSAAIAYAISQVGPGPAKEAWLGRIASGDSLFGMATTEPQVGHNLFRSATEVRRDGDHFVVNGLKRIASGLDVAERVLVFGRSPKTAEGESTGYTTVLLDPHAAGATMTELPMRQREGVKQFQLELNDVRVPADALVGAAGQGLLVMWPFTHVERILTAALCIGSASYGITKSVERAKERVLSGKLAIGAEQAISHPLAGLHSRLEATRLFVYRAAARFDGGVDGSVVAGECNMAKLLTADLAYDAADHAMQVMGAEAWDERNGWLDAFLDARLARSGPVSNEFALNYVALHVLGLPAHK
ncbi:acyl-CoA/acyl-ACP dehydrogenase [Streptomyces bathyalis]|uniref:Acyl-CoA/acyl-ACP dehydrogenase n=1 Tax=Streptomyces bathyalis TaxID=2710756 RepID=A0A7T1TC44_9ACTN|nr:acyl-CoA dehydrogenase family protein [Streptomyces bathyalis]QPP10266.1 acyl-CoA/acyl-ACP dehydrogenase [Streptomyces bathyalis]